MNKYIAEYSTTTIMEITQIKEQLSMSNVLHYYGLKTDKQSRLNCPFHEDKTPSFQVYYKTQTAYCFSSNCKTHGKSIDVIDFILHKENCTKHKAINKAKEILNHKEPNKNERYQQDLSREQFWVICTSILKMPSATANQPKNIYKAEISIIKK